MPAARDPHTVLGVPPGADRKTIRRAFRALAREHHPDLSRSPDAEQRFRELVEAYEHLARPPRGRREPRHDVSGIVSFYAWLAGKRAGVGREPEPERAPLVVELELRRAEAARGGLCTASLEDADGRLRTVEVDVPPYARDGQRLLVLGEEGESPVEVVLRVARRRDESRGIQLAAAFGLAYGLVLFAVIVARATGA